MASKIRLLMVGFEPLSSASFVPDMDVHAVKKQLDASMAAMAAEPDVEFEHCWLYLADAEPVQRLVEHLRHSKPFDAIMVGYAVRTLPQFSVVFEEIVEAIRSHAPRTSRIMFSTTLSDHIETLRRQFPKREM